MAKSKKKRQQFKDFQKVKLKVGKTIAKADNVTNTFFKTKSINIREKLRADTEGKATTKRKLTITDLLSQCEHYTATVRQDAVSGIRELLSVDRGTVIKHISSVLANASALFVDADASVRASTHRLLAKLFQHITLKAITPFFKVISAYLSNAMTHIDNNIQEDSLKILDLLLSSYPSLVVSQSDQILFNFIEQISKESSVKVAGSQLSTRVLRINPNSRISNQKWRIKVLQRFMVLLSTLYELESKSKTVSTINCSSNNLLPPPVPPPPSSSSSSSSSLAPSSASYIAYPTTPSDVFRFQLVTDSKKYNIIDMLKCLSPIMFQCWLEAKPDFTGRDNYLSSDAVATLKSVLSIFNQMMKYIIHKSENRQQTIKEMRNTLLNDFIKYFLAYFPFSQKKTDHQKNKTSPFCDQVLNIAIAELFSYLVDTSNTCNGLSLSSSSSSSSQKSPAKPSQKSAAKTSSSSSSANAWFTPVFEYVCEQLHSSGAQLCNSTASVDQQRQEELRDLEKISFNKETAVLLDIVEHLFEVGLSFEMKQQLVSVSCDHYKRMKPADTRKFLDLFISFLQKSSIVAFQFKPWLDQIQLNIADHLKNNHYLIGKSLIALRLAGQRAIFNVSPFNVTMLKKENFFALSISNQKQCIEMLSLEPQEQFHNSLKLSSDLYRSLDISSEVANYLLEVQTYNYTRYIATKSMDKKIDCEAKYVSFILSLIFGPKLSRQELQYNHTCLYTYKDKNVIINDLQPKVLESLLANKLKAQRMLIQLSFYEKIVLVIQQKLIDFLDQDNLEVTSTLAVLDTISTYHYILNEILECRGNMHNLPNHKNCALDFKGADIIILVGTFFLVEKQGDSPKIPESSQMYEIVQRLLAKTLNCCSEIFCCFIDLCYTTIKTCPDRSLKIIDLINKLVFSKVKLETERIFKKNGTKLPLIYKTVVDSDQKLSGKVVETFRYEYQHC